MNGVIWKIYYVEPSNPILIDRTNRRTVACTDPTTKRIYISNGIPKDEYQKVLKHELCHCALISFGLQDYIYKMARPEYRIDLEEFVCNIIADYGLEIEDVASKISTFVH